MDSTSPPPPPPYRLIPSLAIKPLLIITPSQHSLSDSRCSIYPPPPLTAFAPPARYRFPPGLPSHSRNLDCSRAIGPPWTSYALRPRASYTSVSHPGAAVPPLGRLAARCTPS